MVQSFFKYTRKPVEKIIKSNKNFWGKLASISEVIVLGHSLSPVDGPYFSKIASLVNVRCLWKVSYYESRYCKSYICFKTIRSTSKFYLCL